MSHMQYALSVWGSSLTQKQLLCLQRLQSRAVRLVFSLNMITYLSIIKSYVVSQLIQFHLACVMYHKIIQLEELCLLAKWCARTSSNIASVTN